MGEIFYSIKGGSGWGRYRGAVGRKVLMCETKNSSGLIMHNLLYSFYFSVRIKVSLSPHSKHFATIRFHFLILVFLLFLTEAFRFLDGERHLLHKLLVTLVGWQI
jgi:hypothetical protein